MAWVERWDDGSYECTGCGDFWDSFDEARDCCSVADWEVE